MDTLYIVMPAYNEEKNLQAVAEAWYSVIERHNAEGKSRLLIVDDGSKDSTAEIGRNLAGRYPYLEFITKQNTGHGATVLFAYQYALQANADYIFQTDSDGQTVPEEFEQFWDKRKDFSAIIGYRRQREDGFSRIVVTKTLKVVLRVVFGLNVTDANAPFRLMKRELLQEYLPDVPDHFNLSNVMLTVLFLYNEEDVLFVPITFRQRQGGVNSINIPKICRIGMWAVKDFWKIKKGMRRHGELGRSV
ncbi:MAG: glycosyltransferase family 2 protein [Lachnospiraceae bacterium]|nr:glycosyltransferase family 2 protein [Lachnospiraceae bacterium]